MSSGRKRKTHAEYDLELANKEVDAIPLEEYKGAMIPILHECIEGHIWKVRPNCLLHNRGCPTCYSNKKTKSHEEYLSEVSKLNSDIIVIGEYKGCDTPIEHSCSYGHTWYPRPTEILKGTGCPTCNNVGLYSQKYFDKNPNIANSPGILYCVVLVNRSSNKRECIKIGITKGTSNKNVLKRAGGFTGYDVKIQKIIKGTLQQVFTLEQELHNRWAEFKHVPTKKFGGWTECFIINDDIIKSVPSGFEK